MSRWIALGTAALAIAYGQLHFWTLDTSRSAMRPQPIATSARPALARRVWVAVIDGLGADAAAELPTVRALGDAGARVALTSEFPSFSAPNFVALTTGVPPIWSGVRTNGARAHVPLDNLPASARRAGVPVVAVGSSSFIRALDLDGPGVAEHSLDALLATPPRHELAFLHFDAVDRAGHSSGAASPAYRRAAERADAWLARVWAALDPERDVLVALSDHGHRARGGHGGDEPSVRRAFLVARGAGIEPGARGEARMRDVALPIARLAGIEPPRDRTPDGDAAWARQRDRQIVARLTLALPLALLLLIAIARALPLRLADLAPPAAFAVVFVALYFAAGYGASFTMPRGEPHFLVETSAMSLIAGAAALAAAHLLARPPGAALLAAPLLLLVVAVGGFDSAWLAPPSLLMTVTFLPTALGSFALALAFAPAPRRRLVLV
jgi:hypothetical protein